MSTAVTYEQVCTVDGSECQIYRIVPVSYVPTQVQPQPQPEPIKVPQTVIQPPAEGEVIDNGPAITFMSTRSRRGKR